MRRSALWQAMAVVAALAAWPSLARAQDRLFVHGREVGAFGHFNEDLGRAPDWVYSPRFGGDRYVHVAPNAVLDVTTGRTLPLDEGWIVAYDRARPRVFAARDGGVWSVDVRTGWAVLVLPRLFDLAACVHATSADVLVCAYARTDGQYDLLRANLFGPLLVATVRFAGIGAPGNWMAAPDGSALYLVSCVRTSDVVPNFCVEHALTRIDLATGTHTRSAAGLSVSYETTLVWDEVRDRLFTVDRSINVFARNLDHLGSAQPAGRCRTLAVSPHTDRVYLAQFEYYFSVGWTTLSAYDASSYAVLAGPRQNTGSSSCGTVTLFTAPGAPRDLRAVTVGRTVDLSWTNVGAASHFVLDAGTAPGRTDVSFFVGPDPQVRFTDVPPGTYYVRVRGGNVHGGGRTSGELVVVVR